MTSLFTARRKPKRIVRDEPETQPEEEADQNTGPVVRRPTSNAPRTKSKLRMSFNPGEDDTSSRTPTGAREDEEQPIIPLTKPSRLGLSSAAQSVLNRGTDRSDRSDLEGIGQDHDRDRPSYSKAYLDELRNSTPSTPRDLSSSRQDSPSLDLIDPSVETSQTPQQLDLESKFGKTAISSASSSSRIPTAAEIREKKDRRARLAKEQAAANAEPTTTDGADFISLEDYDSDGEFKPRRMQVGSYVPPTREKNTRLVPDDEDIAEGFDDFVEDSGRVTLSRKAQRQQTLREREAMRALIDGAEGAGYGSDSDGSGPEESDSEYERHQHYESAQTHRGMDGLSAHMAHTRQANRPRQPRETTAIPKLSAGLARLRDMVSHLEFEKARIAKRRADIAKEKVEIKESQAHIQTRLEEAGKELETVTREHLGDDAAAANSRATSGIGTGTTTPGINGQGHGQQPGGSSIAMDRGLESFGHRPEEDTG
ncbi:hypothetical protein LTR99_000729 [Exophiala xenobiotica]|uniref:Nineteen complex-related protein 2-domain-containing protein n=1 Tax=Vermiconidia calcicola TaxID=1690605 RepID=A0AAV9QMS6_9PEZI|nr:hypothetical protein LTR41_000865 [Exophiala xenobiotica]KAK5545292.1 hypothetical protein LTR25_000299 [Vermiconidia calcicola]KAK5548111.1 hypothetical protein LTR23_001820 [Chaetothyriales sp. CCFEE 6169]KAK5230959.1 hypothetical protein LTR72_000139 [Exophiala xenobiotica]KAK5299473.1 hypothetical protein LTR14_001687 [Exophiala xenobiotica]